jgi:hypothetical protein
MESKAEVPRRIAAATKLETGKLKSGHSEGLNTANWNPSTPLLRAQAAAFGRLVSEPRRVWN